MRHAARLGIVALGTWFASVDHAQAQAIVRLGSDDWCPFICAKSGRIVSGLLVEMTDQILQRAGLQSEPMLLPLNRAMLLAERGEIDGVYAPAMDKRLIYSKPLVESRACFYTLTDSSWRFAGLTSLDGELIGAIDDYGYDAGPFDDLIELRKRMHSPWLRLATGDAAGEKNIRMLLLGRLPVIIEHQAVAARLFAAQGTAAAGRIREAGCLTSSLPLVIGVSKASGRSGELIRALDAGIGEFRKTSAYADLLHKYIQP